MKPLHWIESATSKALLCFLVCGVTVHAQSVIAPSLVTQSSSPAYAQVTPGGRPAISLAEIGSAFPATGPLAQWGPIAVRPHFSYRLLYSDGLLNPGQLEQGNSVIQGISQGVLFEIGKHYTLDYTLTRTLNSNRFIEDSSDQSARFGAGFSHGDWTFGFTQNYLTNSPVLVETGEQTHQQFYSTGANVSYRLGSKTLLDVSVFRSSRYANAPASSPEWTTANWFSWSMSDSVHYAVSSRLDVGASIGFSYDSVSKGSNMNSSTPQLEIEWRPTNKISVNAEGGVENRNFRSGSNSDLATPVYGGSIHYQPLQTTAISFGANRSVSASFFANQATKTTSWSTDLAQRLLGKYFLNSTFSRSQTNYFTTDNGIVFGRVDTTSSINVNISTPVLRRGSISLSYAVSHNSSSRVDFGFTSHQIGSEFTYQF